MAPLSRAFLTCIGIAYLWVLPSPLSHFSLYQTSNPSLFFFSCSALTDAFDSDSAAQSAQYRPRCILGLHLSIIGYLAPRQADLGQ
jgi:hypothetical protein